MTSVCHKAPLPAVNMGWVGMALTTVKSEETGSEKGLVWSGVRRFSKEAGLLGHCHPPFSGQVLWKSSPTLPTSTPYLYFGGHLFRPAPHPSHHGLCLVSHPQASTWRGRPRWHWSLRGMPQLRISALLSFLGYRRRLVCLSPESLLHRLTLL